MLRRSLRARRFGSDLGEDQTGFWMARSFHHRAAFITPDLESNRERAATVPRAASATPTAPHAAKPNRPTGTSGRKTFSAFLDAGPVVCRKAGSDTFQT